jgi:hypothetical protein
MDIQGEGGFPRMQYPRGVTMQSEVKFMGSVGKEQVFYKIPIISSKG